MGNKEESNKALNNRSLRVMERMGNEVRMLTESIREMTNKQDQRISQQKENDLYTELDLHRIKSGFHGAFAAGVAGRQGALTRPDNWFRPPFWDLLMLQLLRPNSSNLPCLYSTFHLEYPLVLSRFCLMQSNILLFL